MGIRKRRVAIPFRVNSKEIVSLVDLEEVLKETPELLILPAEDGRLRRFLDGMSRRLASLIDENNPQDSIKELGKALGIEVKDLEETIKLDVVKTSQDLLKTFEKKPEEILLAKGVFEIDKLHIDFDTKIIGVGKNETFLKVKVLSITSRNVEFENLSCEAKVLIGNPPKAEKEKTFYCCETKFFSEDENKKNEPTLIAVKKVFSYEEIAGELLKGNLSAGKELNIISENSSEDSGIYAFLGCGNELKVIDITYPESSRVVRILDLKEPIKKVVVQDRRTYVLKDKGFAMVDISNPESIKIIGEKSIKEYNSNVVDIAVHKNYVFIANRRCVFHKYYDTEELLVFDVSNPSRIKSLTELDFGRRVPIKIEVVGINGAIYCISLLKEYNKNTKTVVIMEAININGQLKVKQLHSFSGQTLKDFTVYNSKLILLYDNFLRIRDIPSGKLLSKVKLKQPYSNVWNGKDFVFLSNISSVDHVSYFNFGSFVFNISILGKEKLHLESGDSDDGNDSNVTEIKIDVYGEETVISATENFICIADNICIADKYRLTLIDFRTGKIIGEVKKGTTGVTCMALSKSPVARVRVEKVFPSDSSKSELKLLLSKPAYVKIPLKEGDFLTDSASCRFSKDFVAEVYPLEEIEDSEKEYEFFFEDTRTAIKGKVKSIEKEDENIFRIDVELQQTTIMDKNIKFEIKDQGRLIAIGVVK